jgi:hypothetical protein
MSHVSEAKTAIKDLNLLKETLKELGYGYYEGQAIKGRFLGGGKKADLAVSKGNARDFGFYKDSDGTYSIFGDFGSDARMEEVSNSITQPYVIARVRQELKKMGAASISQMNVEEEAIKLVANLS